MPKKLPVSGSEPTFTKAPFGTEKGIVSNNCMSYALQRLGRVPGHKLQPGNMSGYTTDFSLKTCHPAKQRVLDDVVKTGRGYETRANARCKTGYAKIMLLLSKCNDFHFIRQNGDLVYTPLPGETPAIIAKKFRVKRSDVVTRGKTVRVLGAGVWSHKRGTAFGPDLYDATGKVIFDPRASNFRYGDLNYAKYCSSFCIKQKPCGKKNTRRP